MWKGGTLRKIGLGEEDGFEKMKEKEEELNGMRGDRKTEPALRCQSAPQIHSNPLPPLHTTSTTLFVFEDLH